MPRLVTTEDWIARARDRHGYRYSYPTDTWGEYKSTTKINIVCPDHGEFNTTLSNHCHIKNPTGCPICADKIIKSREQRIVQAVSCHGDKYDYSLWPKVTKANTMVQTLCKACNELWTHNIDNHVRGRGCPKCVTRIAIENKQEEKEKLKKEKQLKCNKYMKMATEVHEGKYDYSLISEPFLIKSLQPVRCPEHGVFYTVFYNHAVRKSGCPQCNNEYMKDHHMFGYVKWYHKLKKIHPNLEFRIHEDGSGTAKSKIYAKCNIHGEWSTSIDCLKVSGCPSCAGSSQTFLYINNVEGVCIKYGIANDADVRLKNQNRKNNLIMNRMLLFKFDNYSQCRGCESEIKKQVKPVLSRTDLVDGWSETTGFNSFELVIDIIKSFGGVKQNEY